MLGNGRNPGQVMADQAARQREQKDPAFPRPAKDQPKWQIGLEVPRQCEQVIKYVSDSRTILKKLVCI